MQIQKSIVGIGFAVIGGYRFRIRINGSNPDPDMRGDIIFLEKISRSEIQQRL